MVNLGMKTFVLGIAIHDMLEGRKSLKNKLKSLEIALYSNSIFTIIDSFLRCMKRLF